MVCMYTYVSTYMFVCIDNRQARVDYCCKGMHVCSQLYTYITVLISMYICACDLTTLVWIRTHTDYTTTYVHAHIDV